MSHLPYPRGRLRFDAVHHEDFPNGHRRIWVTLEWPAGESYRGEAVGTQTTEGWLRACAQATLQAAQSALHSRMSLSLVGIKAVRAFDSWVIVSAVRAKSSKRTYSLIGAEASPDKDSLRVVVLSVLDAINRVLELYAEPPAEVGS